MPRKKGPTKAEQASELIKGMNSWELNQVLGRLTGELGLEVPQAWVALAQQSTSGGVEQPSSDEEHGLWNVTIRGYEHKINVIKAVRRVDTTMGLKEAKDLVETTDPPTWDGPSGPPAVILNEVSWEEAKEARKELEEAGATVELIHVETPTGRWV